VLQPSTHGLVLPRRLTCPACVVSTVIEIPFVPTHATHMAHGTVLAFEEIRNHFIGRMSHYSVLVLALATLRRKVGTQVGKVPR